PLTPFALSAYLLTYGSFLYTSLLVVQFDVPCSRVKPSFVSLFYHILQIPSSHNDINPLRLLFWQCLLVFVFFPPVLPPKHTHSRTPSATYSDVQAICVPFLSLAPTDVNNCSVPQSGFSPLSYP